MEPAEFQRVEQLFQSAIDLPADQRSGFLQAEAGGDVALIERVERLIRHAEGHTIGVKVGDEDDGDRALPSERPGDVIGRYKLLRQIGEGGFGVVYMAEQTEPVTRRVALKIIKLGMDTRQVIGRFEAERQALALMDHPNIARVLDGGATETGRPYFVMELVKGVPITEYCDRNNVALPDRLRLFGDVCQAVQHAHQKGIIHRDLKPSNVLVTLRDAPVPKVIDFGIAKAMNQKLTERTYFTEFRQLIGTPEYMSPEQAEMSELDVDTRSDVYALGVLLYELMTGTTPFDAKTLRSAAYGEIQRIIREEEPPRPSTRLSTLGADVEDVARRRGTDAHTLARTLRGDLDWIVMRCLEKDRTRRYPTANGLAQDITRHLSDQPVEATPPSVGYRARKFVRRNRAAVLVAGLLVTALLAGVIGTTWGMLRARESAAETAAINEFMTEVLTAPDPSRRGADVRLVDVLETASDAVPERFADHPEREAEVRLLLGQVYGSLDLSPDAEREYRAAFEMFRSHSGDDDRRTLLAGQGVAVELIAQRRWDDAEPLAGEIASDLERTLGPEHPDTLIGRALMSRSLLGSQRYEDRAAELRDVLTIAQRTLGPRDHRTLVVQHELIETLVALGASDYYSSESTAALREAYALTHELLAIRREVDGPDDYGTLVAMVDLSWLATTVGRNDESEGLAREIVERAGSRLGESHSLYLKAGGQLARALYRRGAYDEAADLEIDVAERLRLKKGDGSPDTLATISDALTVLEAADRAAKGLEYAQLLHDRFLSMVGADSKLTTRYRVYVARFLTQQNRLDEAGAHFEILGALDRETLSPSDESRLEVYLGGYLAAIGRYAEAETLLLNAAETAPEYKPWMNVFWPDVTTRVIIDLYDAWDKPAKAEAWRTRRAEAIAAALKPPDGSP